MIHEEEATELVEIATAHYKEVMAMTPEEQANCTHIQLENDGCTWTLSMIYPAQLESLGFPVKQNALWWNTAGFDVILVPVVDRIVTTFTGEENLTRWLAYVHI